MADAPAQLLLEAGAEGEPHRGREQHRGGQQGWVLHRCSFSQGKQQKYFTVFQKMLGKNKMCHFLEIREGNMKSNNFTNALNSCLRQESEVCCGKLKC